MQKNNIRQYKGFISTNPLWKNSSLFSIIQFHLPNNEIYSSLAPEALYPELNAVFVLGKRAEYFFKIALASSRQYELLASNIQIFRNKTTLGEIDFLIRDTCSEKTLHVELVYKFYIYDPSFPEETERWIGPNRRDSLLRKISRLKNHQLPLLHRQETAALLNSLGIYNKMEQQVCFLANLFVPKNFAPKELPYVNNDCIVGYWIHHNEFNEREYGSSYFFTPKKQDWPILPEENVIWYSFSEIIPMVHELIVQKKAPLVWRKTNEGKHERFFIVWW